MYRKTSDSQGVPLAGLGMEAGPLDTPVAVMARVVVVVVVVVPVVVVGGGGVEVGE